MSYRACKTCNKKVTESTGKGYWCARCQKDEESFTLRYVFSTKFSDATGEAWFSIFHEQAEILLGCSADELAKMKSQEETTNFLCQLKKAKWVSFLFRICVARTEYKNVKRQNSAANNCATSQHLIETSGEQQLLKCLCNSSKTLTEMATQVDRNAATRISQMIANVRSFNQTHGKPPALALVTVGNKKWFESYISLLKNRCTEVGIRFLHVELAGEVPKAQCVARVRDLNQDPDIQDISVQLPLPDTAK
ncbi:hypothetical protein L6452_05748 [Arctium lappa]|uniref:Uncharacterized protein n=1 Tax=Arctium lappa TaxID=4217 RepID=A0ACB9EHQ5_ARCLA|nr:hypothetical protein L6452_05748 [Arctium lappa]